MNRTGLWIRTGIIVAITLIGIYLVFGPRRTPTAADLGWQGIKDNLAENINLGLDLKGGSHLVMRVKLDDYLKTLTENNGQAALSAVQDSKEPAFKVENSSTVADNGNYSFTMTMASGTDMNQVQDIVKKKVDFQQWSESTSGNTISWTLGAATQNTLKDQAVEQALKIIESRINAFGVKEPTLQRQGSSTSGQILLQMPGVDDPERVKNLIGADSNLALMKIVGSANPAPVTTYGSEAEAKASMGGNVPANRKILPYAERDEPTAAGQTNAADKKPTRFVVVEYPAVVDGSELRNAQAVTGAGGQGNYQIAFQFKPSGAQKFGEWTGKNINNYMAVVLNGEVKSAAFIKSQIFDSGEISGKFSKQSAEDLALTLKSGALPAKIEYQEERTVGPSLGADSIRAGVEASLGGLALVILFMLFYYRIAGINAVIALVLNMILTIAALVMIKSTLTLPGIAGLILGIGMAVDSNVLIFERIREEIRDGFNIPTAISMGFDRAFVTIIDTHITTIISSLILYMTGSGPIRGFAVTLILGLLINLFTAVFVSRTIFNWELSLRPNMQKLSI